MEITSPGGLAGHADADGVVIAGRAIRNPTLVALLWRMGRVRQQAISGRTVHSAVVQALSA